MADLAPQITNIGTQGQDARYDISGLQQVAPGVYTDGVYQYDSNGLDLSGRPAQQISGLPNANDIGGFTWNGSQWVGSGDGGGGGGSGLLASPYFQQAKAAMEAANAAQESQTRDALRQLLISTGLVPAGFQDKLGVLDDATRQLIQQNTDTGISQYARLLAGKADQQRADINDLASRGLSRSGAKGFKLRRSSLAFDQNKSDLLGAVSGKANQALGDLAQGQLSRQQSLAQFLAQLSMNFMPNSWSNQRPANGGMQLPQIDPRQQAINYWQSNPAPTYTSPTTGRNWYGGINGIESTPFKGKALDSLLG